MSSFSVRLLLLNVGRSDQGNIKQSGLDLMCGGEKPRFMIRFYCSSTLSHAAKSALIIGKYPAHAITIPLLIA